MPYWSNVKVIPGMREIYGNRGYSHPQIVEHISEFNSLAIVEICVKLQLFLQSPESKNPVNEFSLIAQFLKKQERERLSSYILNDDGRVRLSVLNSSVVLQVLKINLETNNDNGLDITDEESRDKFIKIYFSVSDLILEQERISKTFPGFSRKGKVYHFRETFRVFQARQFLQFNDTAPMLNIYARGRYLVEGVSRNEKLNFATEFRRATGLELDMYLDLLFMMSPHWLLNIDHKNIEQNVFRDTKKWFEKMNISEPDIEKFLELVGFYKIQYHEINSRLSDSAGVKDNKSLSNLLLFMNKPILRHENLFTCASPQFLLLQLAEGPYNIVRERLKGTKQEDLLPNIWGGVYEEYVCERLVSSFGKRVRTNVKYKGKGAGEALDLLIDLDEFVLVCEIKYPHWSFKARLTGERKYMHPYLERVAKYYAKTNKKHKNKGLGQIKRFILDNKKGLVDLDIDISKKIIIPVLILGEDYPCDPLDYEYLRAYAASKKCLLNEENVMPFILLTSEDVELIESLTESKGYKEVKKHLLGFAIGFHKRYQPEQYTNRATSFKNELFALNVSGPNSKFMKRQLDKYSKPIRKYFKIID